MTAPARRNVFPVTVIAMLLGCAGPVQAADLDSLLGSIRDESSVSVGVGFVTEDNRRFGQYSGLNDEQAYGVFDFNLLLGQDEGGITFGISGRNIGLDSREVRLQHQRQGDWGYYIDYSEIPREEPFKVHTGLSGIGGSTLIVNGQPRRDVDLRTERKRVTVGFEKFLPNSFDVQVRFRNEEKDGSRRFGRGTPNAQEFLAEPIDTSTRQIDATVGYAGERLQLVGGYYGTFFENHDRALNVSGGAAGLASFTPIGLPPDNRSHQLHLAGGYAFTSTTRGNFKVAYARQEQDDQFIIPSAPGRSNLDGRVYTTLAQAGITSRPLPKLSLLADVRYEDRNDKTPVFTFFTGAGPTATNDGTNEPRSIETLTGKLEAGYLLPMGFRLTGGITYEEKDRNTSRVRIVSFRDETDETSYRLELRRSMSETITGALSYVYSDRAGSPFLTTTLNNGNPGSNLVHPIHLADRNRNKWRVTTDWTPLEPLTLQFAADYAEDKYRGRQLGPRKGDWIFYSVDASYRITDDWQATAWFSSDDTRIQQSSQVSAPTGQFWDAALRNSGKTYGVGVRGKPMGRLDVGADVQYSLERNNHGVAAVTGAAVTPLPDIFYRQITLRAFATYALQRNSGVRLDYAFENDRTDDFTFNSYVYSDGTRVIQDPRDSAHFVGVTYFYRWR